MATPIPLDPQALYRGETARWMLPVVNPDGTAKDFTGADARWGLLNLAGMDVVVPEKRLDFGIIFEDGDPTLGHFIVTIPGSETQTVEPSSYVQEWYITDAIGDVQVYRGPVAVAEAVLWSTG